MENFRRRPDPPSGAFPHREPSQAEEPLEPSDELERPQRTPFTFRMCELCTEIVLFGMIVFTPWAFGTTQNWSIWTMNIAGYLLGLLLLAKWVVRWVGQFTPQRWDALPAPPLIRDKPDPIRWDKIVTWLLAFGTFFVLAYTLTAVVNARATLHAEERSFTYYDCITWLPHSYDRPRTLFCFWMYLGWACVFWAARDWLMGKTRAERHRPDAAGSLFPPGRLERLLWVISLNGGLLALECILQRLDETNKLLWLVQPSINTTFDAQFGPYAYRSNAAEYLNLIWPITLGFWLTLRQSKALRAGPNMRMGSSTAVVLLPIFIITAAAPIISTSRGGAIISVGLLLFSIPVILFSARRAKAWIRIGMLLVIGSSLFLAGLLGWEHLQPRIQEIFADKLSNRVEIYENSRQMAGDFQLLGSGPGTFSSLYMLYRKPNQDWAAYLHDDWVETRITFGWIGTAVLLGMLALVGVRWFAPHGLRAPWDFYILAIAALGGCLIHAKFDLPFQIYSIVFAFLIICAILSTLERNRSDTAS